MAGNPLLLSRRRVAASEWTIDVDADLSGGVGVETKTFAAGNYYNDSSTAAESLRNQLRVLLDSHADATTFTVTYSLTTGKFTITSSGPNFSITWNQTATRDWFGFTGNLTGANTYTSNNVAQGAIYAGSGLEDWTGIEQDFSRSMAVSQSGVASYVSANARRQRIGWHHPFEPPAAVASPLASGTFDDLSAVVPWTWNDFWIHHVRLGVGSGEPFRLYQDVSTATLGGYYAELIMDEKMSGQFNRDNVQRVVSNADTWWRVEISTILYQTAA